MVSRLLRPASRRTYGWGLLALLGSVQALRLAIAVRRGSYEPLELLAHPRLALPVLLFLLGGSGLLAQARLRDAGLKPGWAFLALVPGLDVPFLALLLALPSEAEAAGTDGLGRLFPRSRTGSAVVGALAGALTGLLGALVSAVIGDYGLPIFVAIPFVMGLTAALAHGRSRPRSTWEHLGTAGLAVLLAGLGLLAFALEGVLCILMALPLALPLAWLGGWLGAHLARRRLRAPILSLAAPLLLMALPAPGPAPLRSVRSERTVRGDLKDVWEQVIRQSPMPEPTDWVFRAGFAYPVEVTLQEARVGAERRCRFNTGTVMERVEVFEPCRRLRFAVLSQPPLMREWSPYAIQPRHLEADFTRSVAGEFTLTPLPDGTVRVTCESWYRCRYEPLEYWGTFSDAVVRRIHRRVLDHVQARSERHSS